MPRSSGTETRTYTRPGVGYSKAVVHPRMLLLILRGGIVNRTQYCSEKTYQYIYRLCVPQVLFTMVPGIFLCVPEVLCGPPNQIRGTIENRTYGTHKNLYISLFLRTIFGPVYYDPPYYQKYSPDIAMQGTKVRGEEREEPTFCDPGSKLPLLIGRREKEGEDK